MIPALWKNVTSLKSEIYFFFFDPVVPTIHIYPREIKTDFCKHPGTRMLIETLYNSQTLKMTKYSLTGKLLNFLWFTHIVEYYSEIKSNELLVHEVTWLIFKSTLSERK